MSKWFPTLYKRDSKGKVRTWCMELDGPRYRTHSGIKGGKIVTSGWNHATSKNIGTSAETSPSEQAELEVKAEYKKRLTREYHSNEADIDSSRFFQPMLASTWENRRTKLTYPVYFQPKLDGIRCITTKEGMFSRDGKEIKGAPHIYEALMPLFDTNPDLIFDGELYNHSLKDDFPEITSIVRKMKPKPEHLDYSKKMVQYHIYDLPSSLFSFSARINDLSSLIEDHITEGYIIVVDTTLCNDESEIDEVYSEVISQGYEGGIIRLDARYEKKRSNNLIKRKDFEDEEFEIESIEEGDGNWSGYAKTVNCIQADGSRFRAGLKGSQEYCKQVLKEADDYIGKMVTVQFFGRSPKGIPRFPIAKILHKEDRI